MNKDNVTDVSFETVSFRITSTNVPGNYEQSVRSCIIAGYKWFLEHPDKMPLLDLCKSALDIRVYLMDLFETLENAETTALPVIMRVMVLVQLKVAVKKGWKDYLTMIRDLRKNAKRISY